MTGQFTQQNPFGAFPVSAQSFATLPGAFQSQAFAPFAPNVHGAIFQQQQPVQQIVQSLLIVPQQLQQLLQLAQIQQQQVQYLLQSIPQQLLQLQHQLHQSALQPFSPGISQPFGAQAGYVM
ncbi:MAG TPA: hypothetical protein VH740_06655 [Vicinamibacterales bacterium]|jgi:hypothetical protein